MEANIKSITVKDGTGREVNPNHYFKGQDDDEVDENLHEAVSNLRWNKFEAIVKSYPCPELANTKPGETVEAELVWQYQTENGWHYCDNEPLHDFKRQIYRLVPKEEKDRTPSPSGGIKTAEEIAKEIFYSPATNGQSEASIAKGTKMILEFYNQFAADGRERLMQAFVQTLLMSGYTTDAINAKPKEVMEEAFQYWLDNPSPEYTYKPSPPQNTKES